jgi:arabinofuranan 3-O-arabinosyltransferase
MSTRYEAVGGSSLADRDLSWPRRLGLAFGTRLWPTAILLGILALAVCLLNDPGRWITDSRYEWYLSPGRVLLKQLTVWDPSRGFGRERPEWSPVFVGVLAVVRGLGASPALTERLSHALLLLTAGLGAVALLHQFKRPLGVAHVVAGLFVMFNPYTALFLLPSSNFVNYALAPWFALVFARGIFSARPWRWAAAFALLVFVAGASNVPAFIYGLVLLLPVAIYYVHIERTIRWGQVLGWLARVAALSLLVSLAAFVKLLDGSASLAENIAATESARSVNLASSWSESWRGLGYWLSYWSDGRGLIRSQGKVYLTSPLVALATFGPPCIALGVVVATRWRARLLFALMLLLSVALMVGAFPLSSTTPFGEFLLKLYGGQGPFAGFRNSYKAGAGLCIGVGVLFGMGVAAAGPALARRDRRLRYVPLVGALLLLAIAAAPFWATGMYPKLQENAGIPSYWTHAATWVDQQPGDERVLVVPGSGQTIYRWGSAGDDIIDGLFLRPHLVRGPLPLSNPEPAEVVRAIDDVTSTGGYVPGTLAPIARRYGIRYVVIRNDLDWKLNQGVRPAVLQSLRDDPDLHLVKTFGLAGENTTARGDHSAEAVAEWGLPPVQIYEIRGISGPERVDPPGPSLLVAGGPEALTQLAQDGTLATSGPVQATGGLSAKQIEAELTGGSGLVVSDSNRRRQLTFTQSEVASYTLGANQTLGRPVANLFPGAGTESVSRFPDATSIQSLKNSALFASAPANRPANAFDGNASTTWLTGAFQQLDGQGLRVAFRHPQRLSTADVNAFVPLGSARRVAAATLLFSDGSSIPIDLTYGKSTTSFRPRTASWVVIRIDALYGTGISPFGFREITFPGIDLREQIQVPDDVFRSAAKSPALRGAIAEAPVAYSFSRVGAGTASPEEEVIRRHFRSLGDRQYTVDGSVLLDDVTTDATFDLLLDRPTGALGSARYLDQLANSGEFAVDGSPTTGWTASAKVGTSLAMHFPARFVSRIDILQSSDSKYSQLTSVRIEIGGSSYDFAIPASTCAPVGSSENPCNPLSTVTIPPTLATAMNVVVTGIVGHKTIFGDAPIRINEVSFDDAPNAAVDPSAPLASCVPGLLQVDGQPVAGTVDGTAGDLLSGKRLLVTSCGEVTLTGGWHDLDAGSMMRFDSVSLRSGAFPTVETPSLAVKTRVLQRTSSHVRLAVDAPAGSTLLSGQSYDTGWTATVNGRDLGAPRSYDALNGWRLPAGGHMIVELDFAPDHTYRYALALTFVGLALCVFLVVRRKRAAP